MAHVGIIYSLVVWILVNIDVQGKKKKKMELDISCCSVLNVWIQRIYRNENETGFSRHLLNQDRDSGANSKPSI